MTKDRVRLSIRVDLPKGRFGPGKAALLRAIAQTGSISAAARSLGMSYARAWSLTEDMNGLFGTPLVDTWSGGDRRGGAALTDGGLKVLTLYDDIRDDAQRHTARKLARLARVGKRRKSGSKSGRKGGSKSRSDSSSKSHGKRRIRKST